MERARPPSPPQRAVQRPLGGVAGNTPLSLPRHCSTPRLAARHHLALSCGDEAAARAPLRRILRTLYAARDAYPSRCADFVQKSAHCLPRRAAARDILGAEQTQHPEGGARQPAPSQPPETLTAGGAHAERSWPPRKHTGRNAARASSVRR